jgi:hypothetical protein
MDAIGITHNAYCTETPDSLAAANGELNAANADRRAKYGVELQRQVSTLLFSLFFFHSFSLFFFHFSHSSFLTLFTFLFSLFFFHFSHSSFLTLLFSLFFSFLTLHFLFVLFFSPDRKRCSVQGIRRFGQFVFQMVEQ